MMDLQKVKSTVGQLVDVVTISPGDGRFESGPRWTFFITFFFTIIVFFFLVNGISRLITDNPLLQHLSSWAAYGMAGVLILILFLTRQIWHGEYKAGAPAFFLQASIWFAACIGVFIIPYMSFGGGLLGGSAKDVDKVVSTINVIQFEVVAFTFALSHIFPPMVAGVAWRKMWETTNRDPKQDDICRPESV